YKQAGYWHFLTSCRGFLHSTIGKDGLLFIQGVSPHISSRSHHGDSGYAAYKQRRKNQSSIKAPCPNSGLSSYFGFCFNMRAIGAGF
ncbi:MAG: hypothetical protein ACTHZR_10890, partial [Marinobacter sp.]